MNFDQAFDLLIDQEGGYSNDSRDPGGETMWGVTAPVARAYGFVGDIRELPRETAKGIYRQKYWAAIMADQIPQAARYSVFDEAVNSGVLQAVRSMQRVLDVAEDGVIGPLTFEALQRANGLQLAAAFNGERLNLMTSLPTWSAFGKGWTKRVAAILKGLA